MVSMFDRRVRNGGENPTAALLESPQQLLAAADAARDARRWGEAAGGYQDYLALRPADAAIWVQLGHALKESSNLAGAEGAYRKSLELAPEMADTQLQLGHLYKKMRRVPDAIAAYREAARLDETLVDARLELAELVIDSDNLRLPQRALPARGASVFFDLSDVFFYLRHHQTVSGIQRVLLGIAGAIIAMPAKERAGIRFLTEAEGRLSHVVIDESAVGELLNELSRDEVEHTHLTEIMRSATEAGRPYEPAAGHILLILGAFWVLENIAERIIALRRQGVRVGTLIHDIIPITHPEFCERDLSDAFKAYFHSVLSVADFILTASDHSARCVADFMTAHGIALAPMRTLRSAHRTWQASGRAALLSPAVARLIHEEYAVYVSTIEIRKNHTYLFRIWKRLLDEFGKKTPKLVFVGRPGWRVSDLMDQLESTDNLNGRIVILHDLSDAELAALYRSALFTVFPSFEEGWGLPVGESLVFGRPCIASNTSSVPEVAGEFVDYVDPFNDNDGYQKIRRFVEDRGYLEDRARTIQGNFVPRDWRDVAADLIGLVHSFAPEEGVAAKTVEPPRAAPGRFYRLGHRDDISEFIASGDSAFVHFACDTAWDRVENFGRWLRGRSAAVEFATQNPDDGSVVVLLETLTVGWLGATRLRITVNGARFPLVQLEPGGRRFLRLRVIPESGRVAIEFEAVGEIAQGADPRRYLWMGLGGIGYAPPGDALARLALLEEAVSASANITTLTARPGA